MGYYYCGAFFGKVCLTSVRTVQSSAFSIEERNCWIVLMKFCDNLLTRQWGVNKASIPSARDICYKQTHKWQAQILAGMQQRRAKTDMFLLIILSWPC